MRNMVQTFEIGQDMNISKGQMVVMQNSKRGFKKGAYAVADEVQDGNKIIYTLFHMNDVMYTVKLVKTI